MTQKANPKQRAGNWLMFELQKKNEFDFALVLAALGLWTIGVLLVFSATHIYDAGPLIHSTRNQIIWIVMGFFIILLVTSVPTRFYFSFAYVFYGASLLLLLYGFFTGVISKGAERWVSIAGLRVQPSEFAKIGLLLALARYFSTKTITLERLPSFLVPGIMIMVPFGLILKQPGAHNPGTFFPHLAHCFARPLGNPPYPGVHLQDARRNLGSGPVGHFFRGPVRRIVFRKAEVSHPYGCRDHQPVHGRHHHRGVERGVERLPEKTHPQFYQSPDGPCRRRLPGYTG